MNERIRELAEQADLYARSDNSSMMFEIFQKRYTEKLAELIVKVCAKISEEDAVGDDPACCTNTADRIARTIKNHFGVKE